MGNYLSLFGLQTTCEKMIDDETKLELEKSARERIYAIFIISIEYDKIPRDDLLKSSRIKILGDASLNNTHAVCIMGTGEDIFETFELFDWIRKVEIIPTLECCQFTWDG